MKLIAEIENVILVTSFCVTMGCVLQNGKCVMALMTAEMDLMRTILNCATLCPDPAIPQNLSVLTISASYIAQSATTRMIAETIQMKLAVILVVHVQLEMAVAWEIALTWPNEVISVTARVVM